MSTKEKQEVVDEAVARLFPADVVANLRERSRATADEDTKASTAPGTAAIIESLRRHLDSHAGR